MNLKINFEIEKSEALKRIKKLVPKLKEDFKGQISDTYENWNENKADFGFKAMGFKVNGILNVLDNYLIIQSKLPFAALPFKGMIESKIKEIAYELLKP